MQVNNPFGDNYPFIGPPMDDPSVEKCVYDIYITYYEPTLDYKLPLSLTSIRRRGRTNVIIKDADGATVFSDTCTSREWGSDFIVMEGSNNAVSVAIVIKNGITSYTPDHGELCLRCVYTQPKHVTSISVGDFRLGHNIDINQGYNIAYGLSSDTYNSIRPLKLVEINATPGAGLGQVPTDCTPDQSDSSKPYNCNYTLHKSITTINGLSPDENGTIYLDGDGATKASQVGQNVIQVGDDTTPCCLCEDFSYIGNVLNRYMTKYYEIGATAEAARDSLKDLLELLKCGNLDIVLCREFCPVRAYLDTTWPRFPIITAEIRNVIPGLIKNLRVHVDVDSGSTLEDHTPLRTFIPAEVVCNKADTDAQAPDNSGLITFNGNSWDIDWSAKPLGPGFTVWSTVRVRNGSACKKGPENIHVTVTATFDVEPIGCVKEECMHDLRIRKIDEKSGTVKGGYGWNDPSGTSADTPNYGSNGALKCMLKRVYEICEEESKARGGK